jgi:hypothetical protein
MTDNEIIKALECCCGGDGGKNCYCCPLYEVSPCTNALSKYALDLINRQKAEIERLQKELKITRAYIHDNGLEWDLLSYSKRNGG